jgi:hypothetical protein
MKRAPDGKLPNEYFYNTCLTNSAVSAPSQHPPLYFEPPVTMSANQVDTTPIPRPLCAPPILPPGFTCIPDHVLRGVAPAVVQEVEVCLALVVPWRGKDAKSLHLQDAIRASQIPLTLAALPPMRPAVLQTVNTNQSSMPPPPSRPAQNHNTQTSNSLVDHSISDSILNHTPGSYTLDVTVGSHV